MDTNKMRERFEAWVVSSGLTDIGLDLSRGNHDSYKSNTVHWLYCGYVDAWKESREAVAVDLPTKACIRTNEYTPFEVVDVCREAIENQGLKVTP
ncbi:hypothetical protein [Pseudomonas sp. UBA6562]|uniref:hypothetical protein n=1 Tax=Pseudomonas sp. UBA6562 TaxID=1947332 RepID=UPI0025E241FF|nr:hypothetical protein [Pseudomonas sp. UBA6562]